MFFLYNFKNHIPKFIWKCEFFKNPKWGEFKVKNKCILSFKFSSKGKAALVIIPPSECDIKEILVNSILLDSMKRSISYFII